MSLGYYTPQIQRSRPLAMVAFEMTAHSYIHAPAILVLMLPLTIAYEKYLAITGGKAHANYENPLVMNLSQKSLQREVLGL